MGNQFPTRTGYSFDDVLLVPQYNTIESRLNTNITAQFTRNWKISVPLMSTNMSTITDLPMMQAMHAAGGVGVLHRFNKIQEGADTVKKAKQKGIKPVVASVGIGQHEYERAQALISSGCDIILIDIAHGHSAAVIELLKRIKKDFSVDCIVGNIATAHAAKEMLEAGADSLRVGIGGGSRCTTRRVTGHGVPNLTALIDVVKERDEYQKRTGKYIPIIIDGGLRSSGDIVKALYFGADIACLGNMLAGTKETPGKIITTPSGRMKKYYGMASKEAQEVHRSGMKKGTAAEGISEPVPYKGPVAPILDEITGGVRSGLTYSGAKNISELREKGQAIMLSVAGQGESRLR